MSFAVTGSDSEPLNLSNSNAAAVLRLAGLPAEPCGEVGGGNLDRAVARVLRCVNSQSRRETEIVERSDDGRVIEFGRDDEYPKPRFSNLNHCNMRTDHSDPLSVSWLVVATQP